ncbi:MAG TPA: right-handed parallel beta-helix repeat-containing protein [Polyangiaceae bacterium]
MRVPFLLASVACFAFVSRANAAEIFVSPSGTATTGCTRGNPCSLASAAGSAVAGDTVFLMDGVYDTSLYVANSGTEDAWITFKADQCATPIIEGPGVGPTDDSQTNGVGSAEAEYVRFEGIVARGWNIGFGNGWAGGVDSDEESNGHWEIEHCVSYSNGRTGFTFFSAENFTLKHSISAHNGSSQTHSWSSGVTLFEAHGTNVVEGTISFENTDAERNTDGSGFIVDEESNNATFINNIAFGNAGSCLRLTDSSGTRFFNNTCYHNSQFGPQATAPDNPGELYFTNAGVTVQNVSFMNNVIVGTGQSPAGPMPVVNQPQSGWSNNVVVTGDVALFADPTGANPDFTPAAGATSVIGQGSSADGVPTSDVGFDPKCIVKRTPVMVGEVASEDWWQYDIDIEYIQSIGGVAGCFNPGARSGTPDIGAYRAGDVTTITPGSCIPPIIEPETTSTGTTGDTSGNTTGGAAGATGDETTSTGAGGAVATGSATDTASTSTGIGVSSTTGNAQTTTSTQSSAGGATGAGIGNAATSSSTAVGATTGTPVGTPAGDDGGCGCRVAAASDPRQSSAWVGALGLGLALLLRRRQVQV